MTVGVSERQNAIRLLACINAACVPVAEAAYPDDVVGALYAQSKLQALDFWMRNPDYLANELINEYEKSQDSAQLHLAEKILNSREPDLRRVPMVRYHFGAFEPIDNPLAILRSVDFIRIERTGSPGQIRKHSYLLKKRGRDAIEGLAHKSPEIRWYTNRAKVVAELAGDAGGKALKDRQYLQTEYADTVLKSIIAPITERVRERLDATIMENSK
tara:strand:+ start:4331 stop:4975 length:645 start_codon:yes stop_codon:yes gene_type:complete